MKVYATCHEYAYDSEHHERKTWTISEDPNETGWETDSGCDGYGLTKGVAEYYAKCINEHDSLLSRLEIAEKALERYSNLHKLMYDDAVHGELYEQWWLRQSVHAVEALKQIRE